MCALELLANTLSLLVSEGGQCWERRCERMLARLSVGFRAQISWLGPNSLSGRGQNPSKSSKALTQFPVGHSTNSHGKEKE